jgi:hypothetical protein
MDGGATDPASRPSFAAIVDVWRIGNSKWQRAWIQQNSRHLSKESKNVKRAIHPVPDDHSSFATMTDHNPLPSDWVYQWKMKQIWVEVLEMQNLLHSNVLFSICSFSRTSIDKETQLTRNGKHNSNVIK